MSTFNHPYHAEIHSLHNSESRCLEAAKQLQTKPTNNQAYCEFQTELGILTERLQQCQQSLIVLRQQDQTLAENINHGLIHTKTLIDRLNHLDALYLNNPDRIKQKKYQRSLEDLHQTMQYSHQQAKAFFAGTKNNIRPSANQRPKKLPLDQIWRSAKDAIIPGKKAKSAANNKGKIILFPRTYMESSKKPKQEQGHSPCRIIHWPKEARNEPANHNTPKP